MHIRCGVAALAAALGTGAAAAAAPDAGLSARVEHAWRVTWDRFYLPRTHIFYDYLTSYERGKEQAHLPTAAEVARQCPNECGYGTGMEDGMISAGVMLSLVTDRYAVTREEMLRERAREVFLGIEACATVHGATGFLARAVCPEDGRSVYPNSSRDQYTHAVHGLWLYYHSPLCDEPTKARIRVVLAAVADRMTRTVTAENNYDSLRLDGSRDTRGISRMWNVMGHEAARLPMIYAAAWDATGRSEYRDLWRRYVGPALDQSQAVEARRMPTYAWLQMQASLELLGELEPDPVLKAKIVRTMADVTRQCAARAAEAGRASAGLDLTALCTDWRTGEGLSTKGGYRKVWYNIRESGEAALAELMDAGTPFPEAQAALLAQALLRLDMDRVSSNGIYSLQAAYWKARRRGLLSVD